MQLVGKVILGNISFGKGTRYSKLGKFLKYNTNFRILNPRGNFVANMNSAGEIPLSVSFTLRDVSFDIRRYLSI